MRQPTDPSAILDLLHDSIISYDHAGRITGWNAAAQTIYGWAPEEAIGREAADVFCCDLADSLALNKAALLQNGRWEGEITRMTATGARIIVEVRRSVRRDDLGEVAEIIESSRDITERRRASDALEQNEQLYRTIFKHMPFAFWRLDTRRLRARYDVLREMGVTSLEAYLDEHPEVVAQSLRDIRICGVNQSAIDMMGAQDASQFDIALGDIWLDQDSMRNSMIASFDRGEESYGTISKITRFDGQTIDILHRAVFARGLAETGHAFFGAIDITRQREALDALAVSERRYRDLFNYMPIALWQLDAASMTELFEGLASAGVEDLVSYAEDHPDYLDEAISRLRVIEANEETGKLFGIEDHDALIEAMPRLWLDTDQYTRAGIAKLAGDKSVRGSSRLQTVDGDWRDVIYAVTFSDPVEKTGINLIGAVDVTDQKRAQEALQQLQADFAHAARVASLGELAASIAHEVNQPLAAIAATGEASARWLARDNPNLEEVRILASRIVEDANRAADIIDRIRGMASGRRPERKPVNLNDIVAEAGQFLDHHLKTKKVRVHVDVLESLPAISGDRTQLMQVIVNLIVNAIQAVEDTDERHIWIRTRSLPETVECTVEDSGPGVPAEHAARLFDSFFTTKDGGLGIGLPICRSIIEAHGGSIKAENRPKGARFVFTLPGK